MKKLWLGVICMIAPNVALADKVVPTDHLTALTCLENLDAGTTWSQCLNHIFADCSTQEVGDADHLACLKRERGEWNKTTEYLQAEVQGVIDAKGSAELTELLGQWTGYVVQKCEEVALEKSDTSSDAARLGCEVTELVGLSGEYIACLEGRSAAPYCTQDE